MKSTWMEKLFPTFLKLREELYIYIFLMNFVSLLNLCVLFCRGRAKALKKTYVQSVYHQPLAVIKNSTRYSCFLCSFVIANFSVVSFFFPSLVLCCFFFYFWEGKGERKKKKQHEKLYRYPCHYHSYIHVQYISAIFFMYCVLYYM